MGIYANRHLSCIGVCNAGHFNFGAKFNLFISHSVWDIKCNTQVNSHLIVCENDIVTFLGMFLEKPLSFSVRHTFF